MIKKFQVFSFDKKVEILIIYIKNKSNVEIIAKRIFIPSQHRKKK
jgi:hypothetical protein